MATHQTNRWKLGLFVTAGCALLVAVLLWLGISQLQRRTTPAYFYFDETVNGLEIGSPVKFRGVTIGSVDEIQPAPDRRHIEVLAGLYVDLLVNFGIDPAELGPTAERKTFVSDDLRAQLVTSALTSVSFIQIDVFDPPPPVPELTFATPWETIPTTQSTFKSLEKGITDALDSFPRVAEQAEELLKKLNRDLDALQVSELTVELRETLASGREMMDALRTSPLVDRESTVVRELERSLAELADLGEQLSGPDGHVHRIATRFDTAAAAFQEDFENSDMPAAVAAMERAGNSLSGTNEELAALLRDVRGSLEGFQEALRSLQELTDLLSRDPGSLIHGRSSRALPFRR